MDDLGKELRIDGSTSYVRGCRDKVGFRSRAEAKKVAKATQHTYGKRWPYACRHIPGEFHLTSKPPHHLDS